MSKARILIIGFLAIVLVSLFGGTAQANSSDRFTPKPIASVSRSVENGVSIMRVNYKDGTWIVIKHWTKNGVKYNSSVSSDGSTTSGHSSTKCNGNSCTMANIIISVDIVNGARIVHSQSSVCTYDKRDRQNTNSCKHSAS